jgi:hypothetical protein
MASIVEVWTGTDSYVEYIFDDDGNLIGTLRGGNIGGGPSSLREARKNASTRLKIEKDVLLAALGQLTVSDVLGSVNYRERDGKFEQHLVTFHGSDKIVEWTGSYEDSRYHLSVSHDGHSVRMDWVIRELNPVITGTSPAIPITVKIDDHGPVSLILEGNRFIHQGELWEPKLPIGVWDFFAETASVPVTIPGGMSSILDEVSSNISGADRLLGWANCVGGFAAAGAALGAAFGFAGGGPVGASAGGGVGTALGGSFGVGYCTTAAIMSDRSTSSSPVTADPSNAAPTDQ